MLSPPPAAATSTRASKAGIVRTIEPCCSSAIHHAWRLHSRLHLGRKCRLEKVALVVRRSEAAGWRWSSSTLNECKPRFLGVAVMHWARPMAAELRDSRSGRRQGGSSNAPECRSDRKGALAGPLNMALRIIAGRHQDSRESSDEHELAPCRVRARRPPHASGPGARFASRLFDKTKPYASIHAPLTPHTTHLTQPTDSTRSGSG